MVVLLHYLGIKHLVSGLVWILLVWVLLAGWLPDKSNATGFPKQAYAVAAFVGNGSTVAAIAVLAYVIGLLGVTFGDSVRKALSAVENRWVAVAQWWRWQNHARRRRPALARDVDTATTNHQQLKGSQNEKGSLQALETSKKNLEIVQRNLFFFDLLVHRSRETEKIIGRVHNAGLTVEGLAASAVDSAWTKGVDDELSRRSVDVPVRSVSGSQDEYKYQLIEQDLGFDPLDVLRALDPGLYQAFDRERSEREFRIAVMPPVFALSLWVGIRLTPYAYVVSALALATFILAAVRQSHEPARVLNNIMLKGHSLPSLRAAEAVGRSDVREYMARQHLKQQKQQQQQDGKKTGG